MLLRCCIATLLLLVIGYEQSSFRVIEPVVLLQIVFHSHENGQTYTTRVKFTSSYHSSRLCVHEFKSNTFNAEGTMLSEVNVDFESMRPVGESAGRIDLGRYLFTESPFVKRFWLDHWLGVSRLSVHVYNMSLNQSYVSNLRARSMKKLVLTGNSWPSTSDLILQLPRLKELSLAGNEIEELHPGLLKGCPQLQVLDLSRNKIRNYTNVLYNVQFARRSLRELNLAENIISSITSIFENHWWYICWQIKKLKLSRNEISSFDLWLIPKNCEVDLSFNKITEFPSSIYSFRVDRMVLAGKNISSLSEVGRVFYNIHREMFEYSIANVEIVYDPSEENLIILVPQSECTVQRNYIHCLESASNIFSSQDSSLINVAGNRVKIDESSVFEVWPENLVDLSKNNLKVLNELPSQISHAKELNLSRNSIGYLSRHLFQKMTRLTVLDLSYNQLKHVQVILYSSLEKLDISSNCLTRMNILHSSSKYITEYLNLSHNSFRNILKAEWSQFDQFSKVDLGKNNLECCDLEWQHSRSMFLIYQHKILNLNSSKALTCVRPHYGRVEMTNTWLNEDHCQKKNIQVWVAFGCLLILFPLIIHGVDLVDYFMHQTERDLAERLTRLKKQGLEEDENCAPECKYDAFVCHSHKDAGWVRRELVPNLENVKDGQRLCIHYRDFQLGSFIEENVEKAMNSSRKVIVVVTRSFLNSNWCKMELTFAWEKMVREGRNYIIVIEVDRIPKDKRPPILSYLMRSRTYLEWPEAPTDDEKQECWSRVRDALGKSLRDRGIAAFQMDCEDV